MDVFQVHLRTKIAQVATAGWVGVASIACTICRPRFLGGICTCTGPARHLTTAGGEPDLHRSDHDLSVEDHHVYLDVKSFFLGGGGNATRTRSIVAKTTRTSLPL